MLLAIDPGTTQSAYCWFNPAIMKPHRFGILENQFLPGVLVCRGGMMTAKIVIEKISCYGMPVGESVLETCVWTGRFMEMFKPLEVDRMTRQEVKLELCKSPKANDSTIIQALKDIYGEKGTKKNPGLLYGIKKDEWQALALAYAYVQKTTRQAGLLTV